MPAEVVPFDSFIEAVIADNEPEQGEPARPAGRPKDITATWSIRGKQEAWDNCPEAFRQRYIEGRRTASTPEMMIGRVVDKVAESYFQHKIATGGENLPLSSLLEAANIIWDAEKGQVEQWGETHPETVRAHILQYVELFRAEYAPAVNPAAAQVPIRAQLTATVLIGYIDLIDWQGTIIDLKVVSPKADMEHQARYGMQLTGYSMASRQAGNRAKACRLDVIRKSRPPRVEQYLADRGPDDYAALDLAVTETIKCIKAGLFPPNLHAWQCHPKRCGYWHTCRAQSPKTYIGG